MCYKFGLNPNLSFFGPYKQDQFRNTILKFILKMKYIEKIEFFFLDGKTFKNYSSIFSASDFLLCFEPPFLEKCAVDNNWQSLLTHCQGNKVVKVVQLV